MSGKLKNTRQQAGQLIEKVLTEEKTARQALNGWPKAFPRDPSLQAAYQALWHFEADTAQQQQEMYYMDAQLELLRDMAYCLQQGKQLPSVVLRGYSFRTHFVQFYEESMPIWFHSLCEWGIQAFLNFFKRR